MLPTLPVYIAISIEFQDDTYLLIEGADIVVTLLTNGSSTMPFAVNVTTTPGSADGGCTTPHHTPPHHVSHLCCEVRYESNTYVCICMHSVMCKVSGQDVIYCAGVRCEVSCVRYVEGEVR